MSAPRWARLSAAALVLAAGIGAAGVAAPQQAHAAAPVLTLGALPGVPDCKATPPFATPGDGPAALLDPGPVNPDPPGNPFTVPVGATAAAPPVPAVVTGPGAALVAPVGPTLGPPAAAPAPAPIGPQAPGAPLTPTTTIYQQYGTAGMTWVDYDPGCRPQISSLLFANLTLEGLRLLVAWTTTVTRFAFTPSTLAVFDPIQTLVGNTLGGNLFLPLIPLALAGVGVLIIFARTRTAAISQAAETAASAMAVVMLALACLLYPLTVAPYTDALVTGAVGQVSTGLAGNSAATTTSSASYADGMASALTLAVLYQPYCAGNFGRSSGATSETYCPRLLAASTITRTQLEENKDDPAALGELAEQKADEFDDVADEIKKTDPGAYTYLAGHHDDSRLGAALLGVVVWLVSGFFALVAFLFVLWALMVLRFTIAVLPVVAIPGVFPQGRAYVWNMLRYLAAAMIAAVLQGVLAAAITVTAGMLLAPTSGVPWPLAILLLLFATIAAWKVGKPLRHLKGLSRRLPNLPKRKPRVGEDGQPEEPNAMTPPEDGRYRNGVTTPERFGPPAESTFRRAAGAAITGAAQGAATGLTYAVVTGGGSVAAGALGGAGKGAATAATATAAGPALTSAATTATTARAITSGRPPAAPGPQTKGSRASGSPLRPGDHATVAPQVAPDVFDVTGLYSSPTSASSNTPTTGATL